LLKLEGVTDADVLDEAAVPDEAGAVVVDTADTTDTVPVLVVEPVAAEVVEADVLVAEVWAPTEKSPL